MTYRYRFTDSVCGDDVEAAFLLAVLATESLHGESDTRLDAKHAFDPADSTIVIDGDSPVGRDLNRLFIGFLRRELDEQQFTVERIHSPAAVTTKCG